MNPSKIKLLVGFSYFHCQVFVLEVLAAGKVRPTSIDAYLTLLKRPLPLSQTTQISTVISNLSSNMKQISLTNLCYVYK